MRISDWSSDVCSSDLVHFHVPAGSVLATLQRHVFRLHILRVADVEAAEEQVLDLRRILLGDARLGLQALQRLPHRVILRSEEHTSELQSLMRISYAVFCLKKKNTSNEVRITYNKKNTNI